MRKLLIFASAALLLVSCGSAKKISYFQDIKESGVSVPIEHQPIRLMPEDKISIVVNCKDPEVSNLFNLPYVSRYLGATSGYTSNSSTGVSTYTVSPEGEINFPIVGKIHVEGLTRDETAAKVRDELINNDLVKDPVVTVEYANLAISIFGEVARPGRYPIDRDCLTVLDALSLAGDLTIYGRRDNVQIIRVENGMQVTYKLDLCSARNILSSPVYYLKQNDIIYVEPNSVRARQSTVNGNNLRTTSFWISLASLGSSVLLVLYNVGIIRRAR